MVKDSAVKLNEMNPKLTVIEHHRAGRFLIYKRHVIWDMNRDARICRRFYKTDNQKMDIDKSV